MNLLEVKNISKTSVSYTHLHPGSGSPFRFSWDMIPKTGLSTKDFIAPDSFDLDVYKRQIEYFRTLSPQIHHHISQRGIPALGL